MWLNIDFLSGKYDNRTTKLKNDLYKLIIKCCLFLLLQNGKGACEVLPLRKGGGGGRIKF